MQTLLKQGRSQEIRAYFVWGPFLKSDNESAARTATLKYRAPGAVYFWTPTTRLALELGKVLRLAYGRPAWDVYLLYRMGTVWESAIPAPEYWQHQLDVLQGDPFNPSILEARARELLRSR